MLIEKPIPTKKEQYNNILSVGDIVIFLAPISLFFIENNLLFWIMFCIYSLLILLVVRTLLLRKNTYPHKILIKNNRVQIHYIDKGETKFVEDTISKIAMSIILSANRGGNIENVYIVVNICEIDFEFNKRSNWKYSEIKAIFNAINPHCLNPLQEKNYYRLEELDRLIEVFERKTV
jgi:hypothetical protein